MGLDVSLIISQGRSKVFRRIFQWWAADGYTTPSELLLFLPSIVGEVWFEDSFGRSSTVVAANAPLRGSEVSVDRFLRRARLRLVDVTSSRVRRYHRPRVLDTA